MGFGFTWPVEPGRYNLKSVAASEKQTPPPAESEAVESKPSKDEAEPMLYCPVCSSRLASRKCKLFCQTCGYYMSCADYY
jgi:hypothetical protein